MTPERIQQLLQILWDKVENTEDFLKFVQTYGDELDKDFLNGIVATIEGAQAEDDKDVAEFFTQALDDLQPLAQQVIKSDSGEKGFIGWLKRCLKPITRFWRKSTASKSLEELTADEAEIASEDDSLQELIEHCPNAAYPRAIVNLQSAQQIENDHLIMYCALTLGDVAQKYRPYPKLQEAISAYRLASEKASTTGETEVSARTQHNLGVAYSDLSVGYRDANLRQAVACYQNALCVFTETAFPQNYATAQNNLGTAYSNLPAGDRNANLCQAIACYENALHVFTETAFPQDYAMTQNNLGTAYQKLTHGDRDNNLRQAIACYENALRIHTETAFPQDYATAQNNLGVAYSNLPAGNRDANLRQAIACYQNALRIRTETAFPQDYASTQDNLGSAYNHLPTGDRDANLRQAIACYQNALRIRTETAFPQDYAMTQHNLGTAYSNLPAGDRNANLGQAIACYENALRICTETAFPQDYAGTQHSLGNAYSNLPAGDRDANLRQAIACYHNALRIFTESAFPQDYARTQHTLGDAYGDLPTRDRDANLGQAIVCYHNALRIFTESAFPQDYARTQHTLGNAYGNLPTGDRGENLRHAITCYLNALSIHTKETFPQDYARTQNGLGNAYGDLPTGDRDANLRQAIACYENALHIFTEAAFPREYAAIQHNLGTAYDNLPTGDRTANLRQSITCYENALRVYSEAAFPQNYAMTQNTLGIAYSHLPVGDRTANLRQGIACYQNALRIHTEAAFPQSYAATQHNLGTAYSDLPSGGRDANLQQAIACYHNALRIRTKAASPQDHAATQIGLGIAYADLPTGDQDANLCLAIACFENALYVYTQVAFPQDYARTQNNLGGAYSTLPSGDRDVNLRQAIACFKKALSIYTEVAFPQNYAMTQHNLGIAHSNLLTGDRGANLRRAIACYRNALRIYTETALPQGYAMTQNSLGNAYSVLPTWDQDANLRQAIACYQNALRIRTKEAFPQDYSGTQHNLGNAYCNLLTGDRDANLRRAIACYQDVLCICTEEAFPQDYAMTQNSLGNAYSGLLTGDRDANLRQAITCYQNALRFQPEATFPQERVTTLYNLALAYDTDPLHDIQMAYTACAKAIRVLETHVRAVSSAETRRAVAENQARMYHKMVSLCIHLRYMEDALSFAERGKSRTLAEMLHAAQLQPSERVPEEIRDTFLKVRDKIDELRYRQQAGEQNMPRDFEISTDHEDKVIFRSVSYDIAAPQVDVWLLVNELHQVYQGLLQHIRDLDPEFAAAEQVQPINIQEIEALIPENTVLVECFTGIDGTCIFTLNGKDDLRKTTLVLKTLTTDKVERLVRNEWYVPYYARQDIEATLHMIAAYLTAMATTTETPEELAQQKEQSLDAIRIVQEDFAEWCEELGLVLFSDLQRLESSIESDQFDKAAEILESFDREFLLSELNKGWHITLEQVPEALAEKFWYAKDEHGKSLAQLVEQSRAERVVFIPHSGLHLLPLHLIPLTPNPSPKGRGEPEPSHGLRLLDKYEIAYAPSATMLRFALQRERRDMSHLFAVTNPDRSLVFTDGEVQGIEMLFDNPQSLWYEQATKEAVYKQATDAQIVHFSCHGNFQFGDPMESCLKLVEDNDETRNLTLRDIFANLKLPNAAAVVLSACETGMVQLEAGDEYIGLLSGFLYAGAPTVISSLWVVDDLSTSLLMNRWYENVLQKQMGKAAALRDAQLWMRYLTYKELVEYLEQHPPIRQALQANDYERWRGYKRAAKHTPEKKTEFQHPYHWGAFTCNGSWK
ncbi:MAG: CHAT domain-containing protein [Gammaproteobacteria bacterium]|nr:CHAT domain-containing protein [Gammaproteobacteria bacterium]